MITWGDEEEVKVSSELVLCPHILSLCPCMPSPHQRLLHFTKEPSSHRADNILGHHSPEALFGQLSSLTIFVAIWGDKEVHRPTLLMLQFPSQLRPPAPKISQAGDLGVVADSIHVNLKHTHACVQCVFSIAGPHAFGLWLVCFLAIA